MSNVRRVGTATAVQPSTIKDDNGEWIRLYAVDSTTLAQRPATKEEIAEATRERKAGPEDKYARPDNTTVVSTPVLKPPTPDEVRALHRQLIDDQNLREGREKDLTQKVAEFRANEEKKLPPLPVGPSL